VYSTIKSGSLSRKNFITFSLAFSPRLMVIPHFFLADIAGINSGLIPNSEYHSQETMPLNLINVDIV
jgi:hypothetical protein